MSGREAMANSALYLFPELARDLETLHTTGILPSQDLLAYIRAGYISSAIPIEGAQLQPASLDLRLGPVAYQVRASFLPDATSPVMRKVEELTLQTLDLTQSCTLERGCVYIIPLLESLRLPKDVLAKANPKSTIGRIDLFTRLMTDYAGEFERVPRGYKGELYLEVAPRSFSVVVHQGNRLNQLRLMRGNPPSPDSRLNDLHQAETLIYLDDDSPGDPHIHKGLWISADLQGDDATDVVGYRARIGSPALNLDKVGHYDPNEFWVAIKKPRDGQVVLEPGEFYILASKERIRVPPAFAAEMVPYDPSVGEFRVHYAGFFDPGFGYGSDDVKGTRAVLEVRSHEVPFLLKHGQRIGRLVYERLLSVPEKVYGPSIGSSYQGQGLALSKQFRRGD
jgi:dCTP deaminase